MGNYLLLSQTLAAILIVGTALCLPFYGWDWRRFVASQLFIKCMMWVPIYLIFLVIIVSPWVVGVAIICGIMIAALREFSLQTRQQLTSAALLYLILFVAASCILVLYFATHRTTFAPLVLAVGVSSALSDVFAFFGGKFLGKHHLPAWINDHKSYEGVLGQVIGGIVGAMIVSVTFDPAYGIIFGVIVGAASALGDIVNSIAKRSLGIKDWSHSIPGHGGFLDRFSSLMTAYAIVVILTIFAAPFFSV